VEEVWDKAQKARKKLSWAGFFSDWVTTILLPPTTLDISFLDSSFLSAQAS